MDIQVGSHVEIPADSSYRDADPWVGFEGDTHGDVIKIKRLPLGDRAFVRLDSGRVDWFMLADLRLAQ